MRSSEVLRNRSNSLFNAITPQHKMFASRPSVATVVLACITAVTNNEACRTDEGRFVETRLRDEGSCAPLSEIPEFTSTLISKEGSSVSTAQQHLKRRRRVGFSHGDVLSDRTVEPLLATFKKSWSRATYEATASGAAFSEPVPSSDTDVHHDVPVDKVLRRADGKCIKA